MALTAKKVYAILKRQISDMEAKLNSPVRYRGTVATADLLPLNPDIGDMYNIESKSVYGEAGMNVAWNGVVWDTMGAPIDMSLYIKLSELADWAKQPQKPDYTAEEVGALPANTKIPSKTSDLQNDSGFLTKIPDNYLFGTDKTLSASGKAADAKATGDKITELSADISNKLNKNQGVENSGKIAGINESGDIVPIFPVGVEYNSETNCLEFGSDQKMELNQGIGLDNTLTKSGSAADAGVTGKKIDSLKEDLSTKITKFYASSQGETHLADSDNGKIMDMMVYGRSEQKSTTGGAQLFDMSTAFAGWVGDDGTPKNNGAIGKADNIVSDYIPVEGNTVYSYYGNNVFVWTYDSSKVLIKSYGQLSSKSFTTSETAKYVVFAVSCPFAQTLDNIKKIMFNKGSSVLPWEPYTGGQPSPSPNYPQEIKSVVNPTVKVTNKDGLKVQSVTLNNITINAIPVLSDGDYMDGSGQQWICDEVDCERGTYIQRIKKYTFSGDEAIRKSGTYQPGGTYTHETIRYQYNLDRDVSGKNFSILCSHFGSGRYATNVVCSYDGYVFFFAKSDDFQTENDFSNFLKQQKNDGHPVELFYILATPIETPLTSEKINALKSLSTNYPVTNISVNSEQLDGYTVFNYPISMENGWNYVKQQLNDNRDYIYDMDLQSTEAYVNSEYAVALTELEV